MEQATFDYKFDEIEKNIIFNPEWANKTGYFDPAVKLVELAAGERARAIDTHGRKIIFVGTRFGTCVFFERYTREEGSKSTYVTTNVPRQLNNMITTGALSESEFCRVVGSTDRNIGRDLETLFSYAKRTETDNG